jgi:CRP-like cAMP-binding protein
MSSLDQTLGLMLRKFARRAPLEEADHQALLGLPYRTKTVEPNQYVVREGAPAQESCLILSGLAFRQKVTVEGSRQILSLHMAGDFVDLESSLLRVADHSVQALTRCEIAMVPVEVIEQMIYHHPRIGRAMWLDTLIDASIFREWIVNVGQRDAYSRLAHLFCEFARRLEIAGLGDPHGCEIPMTQEQLADATGLTPVHVNRMLRRMEADGLITRERRCVSIPDWKQLRDVAGFNELYLHLDQLVC